MTTDDTQWTVGGYTCTRCGTWVNNGHPHTCPAAQTTQSGWQCPVCHTVWAPWIQKCTCCIPATPNIAFTSGVR